MRYLNERARERERERGEGGGRKRYPNIKLPFFPSPYRNVVRYIFF